MCKGNVVAVRVLMQFPPPCLKRASIVRTYRLVAESDFNDPHRSAPSHVGLAHATDAVARVGVDVL
jgi:hypothetical protein